ncbi:translationally-controlled tumor protein homolog [Patiria miniata]|uniref:TCTP domain-containing protein n=1 Tax=Patiria miniata TaxID=46514 RepID=A0A913ZIX3_PATMI|nr:translationally-controlled tumor protein homolog [Patiria miniata]
MLVFLDKNFADDHKELFTDVNKFTLIDDVIYEVDGKTVTEKFDSSAVNTGANASAEEAEEGAEDGSTRGPDFVLACRLKKLDNPFSKKEYLTYLKNYLKTLDFPEDQKKELQAKIQKYMLTNVFPDKKKFAEFEQYVAEELFVDLTTQPYPMICLLNYREDTDAPYMVVFKHGCLEQKL